MAVTSLVIDIREFMHDTDASNYRWSDTRILRLIDQGQKDLARRANALRSQTSNNIAEGTKLISLPSSIVKLGHITIDDCPLPLKTSFNVCVDETSAGKPEFVVKNGDTLLLYPTSDGDYTVIVNYIKLPDTIDSLTDALELGIECEQAIKFYTCGHLYRDDKDTQSRQMGIDELQLYATEVKLLQKESALDYTAGTHYEIPYRRL
ncbi:MAG: hypothetical protein DRG27_03540 [Deltaproteobacteria bacterium]|nr:MAG: hypothetical protein DRG27_03540 [Deltaproteobacteria bacterium]